MKSAVGFFVPTISNWSHRSRFTSSPCPFRSSPEESVDERRPDGRDDGLRLGRLALGLRGVLELLQFPHGQFQIAFVDDVVAVEHRTRSVAADSHGHPLLHA